MALTAEVERDIAVDRQTAKHDPLPPIIAVIDGIPRMCTDGWRAITMPACSDAAARIALLKHGAREALAALEALAAPDGSSGSGSVSASEDALQRSYRELLERPGTMLPSHANLLCALLQLVPQCRLGTGTAYRGASGGGGGGDGGGTGGPPPNGR